MFSLKRRAFKLWTRTLPAKRVASGALITNAAGEILFVEPTYKKNWEIPGGTVEKNESPKAACQREILEELKLDIEIGQLLHLHYRPESKTNTEVLLFIFDGGTLSDNETRLIKLPALELSNYFFIEPDKLPPNINNNLQTRILAAYKQRRCQQQEVPGYIYSECTDNTD